MTALSFHPLAQIFPLIEGDEFDSLVADIKQHGVREAIWLYEGQILDGRNRYRASAVAGVDCPMRSFEGGDPVSFVVSLNLKRRHLDDNQRAAVAAKIANLPHGGDRSKPQICGLSVREAAALLNVKTRSVEHAKVVQKSGAAELKDALDQGLVPVSVAAEIARLPEIKQQEIVAVGKKEIVAAYKAIRQEATEAKKEKRQEREQVLAAKITAFPDKRYGVILADPEWRFEPYSRESGMDRAADNHYPTSATDGIASRDVASIAAPDCVLFLWATVPMLPDALRVMESWGFEYRSHLIWSKDRLGTGYWFRNKHELLLVGVRGAIPAPALGTQWPSVIEAAVGAHSAKPEQFLELIESYFPTLPKIELNRRGDARPGWDAWGNEATQLDEVAA